MLEREGIKMNQKKLRRLYKEESLEVKRRRGRKRAAGIRALIDAPTAPNERWSLHLGQVINVTFQQGSSIYLHTLGTGTGGNRVLNQLMGPPVIRPTHRAVQRAFQ